MRRILLALTLTAATVAAGVAQAETNGAETTPSKDSVAVRIAGLSPQAARQALRVAAREVCKSDDLQDQGVSADCYNTTLRYALGELKKAERGPVVVSGAAETASR
jgi:hypothetical protein